MYDMDQEELALMDLYQEDDEELQELVTKADIALAAGLGGPAGVVVLGGAIGANNLRKKLQDQARKSNAYKMK